MKFLLFFPLLFLLNCNAQSQTHFDKAIGKQDKGKSIITADLEALKSTWQTHVNFTIDKIEITQIEDQHVIKAISAGEADKAIVLLALNNGVFYESVINEGGTSISCSCSSGTGGIAIGCDPFKSKGTWFCNACVGSCTKTITVSERGGIFGGNSK